jgi:predicted metal-binding membrane protein
MSAMGGMPMPGGWKMSMAWMRMPGTTWPATAASFLGMWLGMMVAMMLPSLVPMLSRYRTAVGRSDGTRLGLLTTVVGGAYFFVWMAFGVIAFTVGMAVSAIEMRQPAIARVIPVASGAVVLIAGAIQFTDWKANRLACCREAHVNSFPVRPDTATAWRHGLLLGFECACCCAGLIIVLLVVGIMDLRAMAAVTAAITAERLLPGGPRVSRLVGYAVLGGGFILIARAGLG